MVAVTEGPFSMIAFPYAVALMGKKWSAEQLSLLYLLGELGTSEFVVALDAEVDPGPLRDALADRVEKVSVLELPCGDPWDNRELIGEMMKNRTTALGCASRVRAILRTGKY